MFHSLIKVTWEKDLGKKCEICGNGLEKGAKESNVIKKYFLGVKYSQTVVCQGCISRMLRNFVEGR